MFYFRSVFQNYKATANYDEGKALYDSLSAVSSTSPFGDFLQFRDIVVARKQPRKMFVQAHTEIRGTINIVELIHGKQGLPLVIISLFMYAMYVR